MTHPHVRVFSRGTYPYHLRQSEARRDQSSKGRDIVLNDNYEALGQHYMTAIMPAMVKKPKQKASVEGTVGKIATAIIAKLRAKNFNTFEDLKEGVSEALVKFNGTSFQRREDSRYEVFRKKRDNICMNFPISPVFKLR